MTKITKEQVLDNLEEVKKYITEAESGKKEEKVIGLAIKSRWTGSIIFQSTKTTYKEAVAEAVARGSNLRGSNLSGSNLRGSNLRDSNLRGSNLRGSNLRDSDLSGSNLRGSNLRDSNLRDSDLSGSDLRGSNLSGSNLSGSDLRGSDLRGAEMQNVKFYGRGGTKPLKRNQLPDFLAALGFVIED